MSLYPVGGLGIPKRGARAQLGSHCSSPSAFFFGGWEPPVGCACRSRGWRCSFVPSHPSAAIGLHSVRLLFQGCRSGAFLIELLLEEMKAGGWY